MEDIKKSGSGGQEGPKLAKFKQNSKLEGTRQVITSIAQIMGNIIAIMFIFVYNLFLSVGKAVYDGLEKQEKRKKYGGKIKWKRLKNIRQKKDRT